MILLVVDMVRRVRRVNYRAQIAEDLDAEEREIAERGIAGQQSAEQQISERDVADPDAPFDPDGKPRS